MQNPVDPLGNIIHTSARGAWMGNRGQLPDDHQNIHRLFKLKAWLTCLLQFKGRKRQVIAPNRYTELFFLDEATAFSAGHRPCFECRRNAYNRFKYFWLQGNSENGFAESVSIWEIDNILHNERIDKKGKKVTHEENSNNLPGGAFVLYHERPHLVAKDYLFHWSPSGYDKKIALPKNEKLKVLTTRSVVNCFRAGYIPQMAINIKG